MNGYKMNMKVASAKVYEPKVTDIPDSVGMVLVLVFIKLFKILFLTHFSQIGDKMVM